MSDEDNPYRFAGNATPAESTRPRLTMEYLRLIAQYRLFVLAAACAYYVGVAIAGAFWFETMRRTGTSSEWTPRQFDALVKLVLFPSAAGIFSLVIIGGIAIPWISPRSGALKTFALLAPIVNVIVVAAMLSDARRMLEGRGVRVGWLKCDFSRAVPEPALDTAASRK